MDDFFGIYTYISIYIHITNNMISVCQKIGNSFCSGAVTVVCGTRSQFGITTNNSQFLAGNSLSAIFEGNFETNMSALDP